jgi:ribosome maturation factor RimP
VTALRPRLVQLLAPLVEAAGLDLEDVSVSAAGRRSVVRVVVDKDGGAPLDDVAEVSRVVSEVLDALDAAEPGALGASYVLEVSSPGVDRPLTAPRHWRRNTDRLVKAVLRDGGDVTGRVLRADDGEDGDVVLDVDGSERAVAYADVARGLVQVEFNRPGGGSDDTGTDDDIDDEEQP